MANNLDLFSGTNVVFASLYTDAEVGASTWLDLQHREVSSHALDDLCRRARVALEQALEEVGPRHWVNLLEVGRGLAEVLTTEHCKRLRDLTEQGGSPLLRQRLRGDGRLAAIPWELLCVLPDRLLGEVFTVGRQIVAPAGGIQPTARPMIGSAPVRMLIVVDSTLPKALEEGQHLRSFLRQRSSQVTVELVSEVTREYLCQELPHYDIVHFAGDAEVATGRTPGWRLNAGECFDAETLRLSGVQQLPFLVFANACRMAELVRQPGTWGPDDLAFHFLMKGVRHYIGTFARIPDHELVILFAEAFYETLLQRKSVGEALSTARKRIRADGQGRELFRGRLVAANYLHYGNPGGSLFEDPGPTVVQNTRLQLLMEGMMAHLRGDNKNAKLSYARLRQELATAPADDPVVLHLDRLLNQISEDQQKREQVRHCIGESLQGAGAALLSPGTKIGPFELVEELGHGPQRTVYRARSFHEAIPAFEVALALPRHQHDDEIKRQAEELAGLQSKLDHPGLVQIYDARVWDGVFAVAYELAPGIPLDGILADGAAPWPLPAVCRLVSQVGEALDAANGVNLVHGRLTPKEIRIDQTVGTVKLLDVGRDEAMRRARLPLANQEERIRYLSPDQLLWGDPNWVRADNAADRWSLALIAYQLLTGHHPLEQAAAASNDWVKAIREGKHCPPSLHLELPEGVDKAFARALALKPEERYRSAAEFARALSQANEERAPRVGGFEPDLESALEAGLPLHYISSDDEVETLERLEAISERLHHHFFTWRLTTGITRGRAPGGESFGCEGEPLNALDWLIRRSEPTLLVLLDFDVYLDDMPTATNPFEHYHEAHGPSSQNPPLGHDDRSWESDGAPWTQTNALSYTSVPLEDQDEQTTVPLLTKEWSRKRLNDLVDALEHGPAGPERAAVIVAPAVACPEELAKRQQVYRALPATPGQVRELLEEASREGGPGSAETSDEFYPQYLWHATGLTRGQIRDSLRLSLSEQNRLTSECLKRLQRDKQRIVRRTGLLELWQPSHTLEEVVGLDWLKQWFAMIEEAVQGPVAAGLLPPPKGVLLGGMPGCGKSLCAQAMAGSLRWPLLRLDLGRIFGSHVGQSERNLGAALAQVEQMSPAVLWVDEIEKGLGLSRGTAGSGTTARVFHTLLYWLQDRTACVFVVATANDGQELPGELLRAGRFDGCFFLDFPNREERQELLKRSLATQERDTTGHDFAALAAQTAGFSGADLVGRVQNALFLAARSQRADPTADELRQSLTAVPLPLARRPGQAERLSRLRALWLSFALPASPPE